LVPSPVFVISSIRSGSTLLRVLLNTHSKIVAPHELHLHSIRLQFKKQYTEKAVDLLGLDKDELEHLLWDRVLDRQLSLSGKEIIVDKTPENAVFWPRLRRCWPEARYIFLLRHPLSIAQSWMAGRDDRPLEKAIPHTLRYVEGVEAARKELPGLTVRYEDLTADPEKVTREICDFLGVPWERQMLDYGKVDHGPFKGGIGDWSKKIRSGTIQKPRPLPSPDEVPEEFREIATAWGYMDPDPASEKVKAT